MESTALMKMSENTMLARIEQAKFPQALTAQDKKLLALGAIGYGFDPLMGEMTIYQGRLYISIDGRYRKAQETGKLNGVVTRPATKQEREDWSIPIEDYFFRAEVQVKGAAYPFVGWGRVRTIETQGKGYKPVETNPQRMAEKRAEAQALRKGFSIPLPSVEDIGFEEEPMFEVSKVLAVEVPPDEDIPSPPAGEGEPATKRDDPDPLASWTGTSRPTPGTQKPASETSGLSNPPTQALPTPAAKPTSPVPTQSGQAEEPLRTLGELWGRCNARGITIAQAFEILGIQQGKDWGKTPDEAWARIKPHVKQEAAA